MREAGEGERPEATLARVLQDLGTTFLRPLAAGADLSARVGGIAMHDPLDEQVIPRGAIVLGVGLRADAEVRSLLQRIAPAGASALVLREPVTLDPATQAQAAQAGVVLLGLARGASWTQLGAMLSSILAHGGEAAGDGAIGGVPSGDLFTLANAIAALLDAPVTIEDRNSRVLAFSGSQDQADAGRIATILERQVPEPYSRVLAEAGVFRRLYASDEPVFLPLDGLMDDLLDASVPRTAIAVRAGDEILGSIWAATPQALSPERSSALRESAKLVALHLLRVRAGGDIERRLRADLLGTALEGREGADYALERLGLHGADVAVLAMQPAALEGEGLGVESAREAQRQRIADAISVHLAAVHPQACAALVGDTVYGLLPVRSADDGEADARRLAEEFLARVGRRTPLLISIGAVAVGGKALPLVREGADRGLRVLREQHPTQSRLVMFGDVHVEALLLELRDRVAARGERPAGPLARLLAHDRANGTEFVETLRAWLDAMGDVAEASEAVHVHPNTLRYRLRRITEVSGLDLTDAEARFAAQVQLRVLPGLSPHSR
ncbi:helix-turn-helix domain-containing protein [Microbacterium sp. ARD32]|uniref:PucR family transcriptional regulator n=1 Tax=Microbacterium sp. ARD32 TaxID=2962577 RepID=UPI002881D6B2|nr:helix-turn-helix domain-containing protein [Microbacterium sp. ARD32]MDT0157958.1 helix-turn-helix domain-containing protein [Microbacterium sp. ARD32]